jgi:2-methylcitrate dehydratase PrpD
MSLAAELADRAHAAAGAVAPAAGGAPGTAAPGWAAAAAIDTARRHFTDTVGALIAGYHTLRDRLEPLADGLGLSPADPVGRARRVAYLGGAYAHCWELDDIDRTTIVCPGCVVLPAVLGALHLRPDASWPEVLGAYLAGYEVALGAADAAGTGNLIAAGWWPTSLFAPAGAAAAVSVLLGQDSDRTRAAIGLAAQQAGGLVAGTNDGRYLLSGVAAERALCAALAAGAGWHGPDDVFDHDRSPLRRRSPAPAGGTGAPAAGPLAARTSIKAHAAAKHLQAAVDIVLRLRAAPGWSVDEIVELRCELPHHLARIVDRPAPLRTATGALASAQYVLAFAALTGGCYPRHFTPAWLGDPDVLRLAGKIRVVGADDLSARHPGHWGARVEVITAAGRAGGERLDARGDPERPMSVPELVAKFAEITAPRLTDAHARRLATALLADEPGDQRADREPGDGERADCGSGVAGGSGDGEPGDGERADGGSGGSGGAGGAGGPGGPGDGGPGGNALAQLRAHVLPMLTSDASQ